MRTGILAAIVVLLLRASGFGQLPASRCDANATAIRDCSFLTQPEPEHNAFTSPTSTPTFFTPKALATAETPLDLGTAPSESDSRATESDPDSGQTTNTEPSFTTEGIHWRRALTESFTFLIIEQAYVVHTDFRWVVTENGIPFNHYWRDYMQSLTSWWHAGWSAGEDPLYNYLGHPIQGAITEYIEINNDPRYERLEFSNTKAYWKSRLKATVFNAVYSTQWSIGLLSEPTVEKYGSKARPPWNANGSYPCDTKTCYSGVGKVNLVMTPVGGLGWVLAEDILDKKVAERVEQYTQNRILIDFVRSATNPIREGANILHGNRPWYRARDDRPKNYFTEHFTEQRSDVAPGSLPPLPLPTLTNRGNVFFGYSHLGSSHCEAVPFTYYITCDPLSSVASNLSGWNTSVEKMYLRYFGAVADFSGQYGGVGQTNFLFGIRGGSSIGRFRPFAHVMYGFVREHGNTSAGFLSDTTFAEDLGVGLDFRLLRRLSWRNQLDELKTGSPNFKRYNVHVSSGFVVKF